MLQGPALRKLLFMTRPEVRGCSPAASVGLLSGTEGHGWRSFTLAGSIACRAGSAQSACTQTRASLHCCPLLYNKKCAPYNTQVVDSHLKPHWSQALEGVDAETMQAVPDMLGEGNWRWWLGTGWLGTGLLCDRCSGHA